ncbi:MAG TPA: 2Fe-2S iron-sulfur cluster-binding protein, partial [Burkholderiaceae bacterium]|nr:2Fe-2S iron-sulfur cluster-binding protein [Burkholderiaceae bacterium]
HLYVCGPAVMIEMVVDTAQAAGWPDNSVHREYFGNNQLAVREGDTAFEVVLQRSGKTITVPVGRSIASVAREIGVMTSTVCEQGACGTCETVVLAGEPDHRDVYLSPAERASGRCTMVCVSRAKSATLVLDL